MGQRVIAGMTMSLDGYVTGPDDHPGQGLGRGGERLHYWVFGGPWTYADSRRRRPAPVDQEYIDRGFGSVGAIVVGRHMYEVAGGWGDEPGFGVPVFVVTHRAADRIVKGNTTFEFETGGADAALQRGRAAAAEKNVMIMGGRQLLGEYFNAGVVDEFVLTIAPILLGSGKRLFEGVTRTDLEFERAGVIESPFATHIRYLVRV
ncbi:MAG TPA: dihydrofolate reductase family protein [Chloroflexota bacterium]|nr:dihydrofolate reductase family protein [Chloroflexota bacterium]